MYALSLTSPCPLKRTHSCGCKMCAAPRPLQQPQAHTHTHARTHARAVRRYYFQVGSTDALERKLDESQRELQIPPSAHVPVKCARVLVVHGEALLFIILAI